MADFLFPNLHKTTFNLSPLSLPLNLSPPNFSIIRFAPPRRRFSHSSLLPKLSSGSSHLDIISKTVHSDGTVSFTFGDASEFSQVLDYVESVNGVELEREDSRSLDNQAVTVFDDESDGTMAEKIIVSDVKLKEAASNSSDSLVVVEDEQDCNSSSVVEESENSSVSLVDDEPDCNSSSVEEVVSLSDFEAVKNEDEVEVVVVVNNVVAKCKSNVEEAEELSVASEDLSDAVEATDDDKIGNGGDESASSVEDSDGVVALNDEIVEPEVNNSAVDNNDKIENGDDELSFIASVEAIDGGKLEYGGDESSSKISELSLNLQASEVALSLKDDDDVGGDTEELISKELEAEAEPVVEDSSISSLDDVGVTEPSLGLENKVLEADNWSSSRSDDDQHNQNISDSAPRDAEPQGIASEITFDRENSLDVQDESSGAASSPLSSEVNGASPNLSQSDDQPCSDISPTSVSGLESSGIGSDTISFDSMEISTVANSMTPTAASSLGSTEVHDTTTDTILESADLSDVLSATDLFTSEITSGETSLASLNEMETSAPALFTSSAGASLSHSVEALAGGKDAYFVSEDWFGVADGVGQWSLEGIDIGLYGHELMQNCEKLLKSINNGITNVKELLKQSVAMTEYTGSARVIIAHVANQVLHVANIGDSGFVVIRNGIVFKKSSPMVHEFGFPYAIGLGDDSVEDIEEYHVELEDGDMIITATDGLFDNLYEEEIASIVSKALEDGMHVQDIAELLGTKAQEVGKSESARSPFADAAQAAGHPGYSGGKHDHVTVVVSLVQTR